MYKKNRLFRICLFTAAFHPFSRERDPDELNTIYDLLGQATSKNREKSDQAGEDSGETNIIISVQNEQENEQVDVSESVHWLASWAPLTKLVREGKPRWREALYKSSIKHR